jgi:hypothetical protein
MRPHGLKAHQRGENHHKTDEKAHFECSFPRPFALGEFGQHIKLKSIHVESIATGSA